jgi:adenine-specific DNA-methyltransferase
MVKSIDEIGNSFSSIDSSISRIGQTVRQDEWMQELLHSGVRGKTGQKIEFLRVETLSGTRWLHCDADTKENNSKRVAISFGPEYSPLDQRQVAMAIEEAQNLIPKPAIIIFAAFQFDPEASKDIEEIKWPGVTILKAQMNPDLLVGDLKKKRSVNESFWLMGQPDIEILKQNGGKYAVEIHGFDYYNSITGEIESGDTSKITMWMLDIDYDGRSIYPQQIFFPLKGNSNAWSKISKSLNMLIDEEKIEKYKGTISFPFSKGKYSRIAIKIIDDKGIESIRIQELK